MSAQWRNVATLVVALLTTAAVSACTKADGTGVDNSGGPGLPPGASKAQYQAAFEDVEPIELSFQVASSNPEAYSSKRDVEFAESLEEWSGGKITVDIHYAGAISEPTETPDALVDGRLDLAHYYTTYEPNEMPAYVDLSSSLVQVPSTPLVGEIVLHAVHQEMAFRTPEIVEEFESRGMHLLAPASSFGVTELICSSERESPAAFEGAQIRGNALAHETEVGAMGGTISTVELAEGYEAFQRGILDCSLQAPATADSAGWLDVAPHAYFPRSQGFAPGAGSLVAGSTWDELPLVAQQLMSDRIKAYMSAELFGSLQSIADTVVATSEHGGSTQYLDAETEKALTAANERLLEDVEDSPVVDGEKLNAATAESIAKWTRIATRLGYTDEGDVADFTDWYQGSGDFEDRAYLEPIADRIYDEIFLRQRPR